MIKFSDYFTVHEASRVELAYQQLIDDNTKNPLALLVIRTANCPADDAGEMSHLTAPATLHEAMLAQNMTARWIAERMKAA